ncbi:tachylectin-related carbohydrate-binding protein [Streptomyces sp. NPDC057638]|uniref:tachylectin-related carbohydrate-binding protein n=1 Tax=Streptomyces sp. NPDC057638 TaxID=3346190 RepID=UPI003680D2B1
MPPHSLRRAVTVATAAVCAVPLLIAAPGTAHASVNCRSTAVAYAVHTTGLLQQYRMPTPASGAHYTGPTTVGTGWQTFGRVLAGPGGDFYAARTNGLYYGRYNGTTWDVQPKKISNSFGNLANTADRNRATVDRLGWLWYIDSGGNLRAYHYDDAATPTGGAWTNSGVSRPHDTGWDRYNLITAGDAGVLYGRDASDGKLYRSRYDLTSQRWIERHVLVSQSDWRQFKSISSQGGDTLVATKTATGEAFYYRFDETTRGWPVDGFRAGSSDWEKFTDVTAAPDTCRITGTFTPPRPTLTQEPYPPSSVAQVSGGVLEFAYTDNIGRLMHGRMPDPSNVQNVLWSAVSGNEAFTGQPSLSEHADGRVSLTALNLSSSVWHRNQAAKSSADWAAWNDLAGHMKYRPITAKTPAGLLTQFAVDANGKPWFRQLAAPNYEFRGWIPLTGTGFAGALTAVTVRNGIQLFGRDATGLLRTALFTGDGLSGPWTTLGTQATTGTASVVVYPGYRMRVFAADGNGRVVTTAQAAENGAFGDWSQVGDLITTGSPSALISPTSGLTEVAVRSAADGRIHSTGETTQGSGVWRVWRAADAGLVSATDPVAFAYTNAAGPTWAISFRTADNQSYLTTVQTSPLRTAKAAPVFTTRSLPAPR